MKTQIIVVNTTVDWYNSRALESHFRSLYASCKGKRTGMIFSEDEFYRSESSRYWQNLEERVLEFSEIVDFTSHIQAAHTLAEKSFTAPSLLSKRHFEAQAYFMRLVGDVRSLKEEISDKELEVVVMEFYKGFFLQQLYPDKFSLSLHGVDYVKHEDAYRQLHEFRMLHRISPFSESYIDGTWDIDNPLKGSFEVHFVDEPYIGKTQGLIPDVRGLATFSGEIRKNSFDFRKLYFLDSVRNDQASKDRLTSEPINYALYAGFRDGHYWWDGREIDRRFCSCEVKQKIGYT